MSLKKWEIHFCDYKHGGLKLADTFDDSLAISRLHGGFQGCYTGEMGGGMVRGDKEWGSDGKNG